MLVPFDLETEFARLTDFWSPRVVARVNDQYVKVAKLQGEFVWHAHADEDELFMIVRGRLVMQLEDGEVTLGPGQCLVVPRAVRHNPMAAEECWVVLVEPVATKHTGDVVTERTRSIDEQLA
jgi:mannose-6-phosphate isomerase-like protein (cupin superfamily)